MKRFIQLTLIRHDMKKIVDLFTHYVALTTEGTNADNIEALGAMMPQVNKFYQKYNHLFQRALTKDVEALPLLFNNLQITSSLSAIILTEQGNYEASNQVLAHYEKLIRQPILKISQNVFNMIDDTRAENDLSRWIISFDTKEQLFTQDEIYDIRDNLFKNIKKPGGNESLALYYFAENQLDKAKSYLEHMFRISQDKKEVCAYNILIRRDILAFQCSLGRDYQQFLKATFKDMGIEPKAPEIKLAALLTKPKSIGFKKAKV